jgi:hypothetical protein
MSDREDEYPTGARQVSIAVQFARGKLLEGGRLLGQTRARRCPPRRLGEMGLTETHRGLALCFSSMQGEAREHAIR